MRTPLLGRIVTDKVLSSSSRLIDGLVTYRVVVVLSVGVGVLLVDVGVISIVFTRSIFVIVVNYCVVNLI